MPIGLSHKLVGGGGSPVKKKSHMARAGKMTVLGKNRTVYKDDQGNEFVNVSQLTLEEYLRKINAHGTGNKTKSPAKKNSASPAKKKSASPAKKKSKSPAKKKSKSPAKKKKSPAKSHAKKSTSPAKKKKN